MKNARKAVHIEYSEQPRNPLPGNILFKDLHSPKAIILASNPRASIDVIMGILQAAKDCGEI